MRKLLFLLFCLVPLLAESQAFKRSKKVTLLLDSLSVERALSVIGISYDVSFSYSDDVVPTQVIVNLRIENEDLASALGRFLRPFGIGYKAVGVNRIVLWKLRAPLTQTIRGTVVDEVTGVPIPGASVIVADASPVIGTITDDFGKFRLERVPVGRISLTGSRVGYDPETVGEILLATGNELVVDVRLTEAVVPMEAVVVSDSKYDGIPGDGAAITSSRSFSVEESKRYAGSMGDPARMASAFSGVTSLNDETNALVIRGNSPRGVLWRIEGVEVPNPNHFATEGASHGVVSALSSNIMGTSDFLTGAFPSQYGNALSGVFDIQLRNGNSNHREYAAQAGLLGLEASAEGPLTQGREASYLINYRYSTLSILDKLGFGLDEAGKYKDYQDAAFKVHYPISDGTISVFGIGGKSSSNITDTTLFDNSASDMGVTGLTVRKMLSDRTVISGVVSHAGTRIMKNNELHAPNSDMLALNERYTKSYTRLSLSARRKVTNRFYSEGGVTVSRLNYNFHLQNIDTENPAYQVIVNFNARGHSYISQAFLQARQYITPHLLLFYGSHFIHLALTDDASFEPRGGLRWEPTARSTLSAAYGKHSRIENLQYYLARDHQPGGNELQFNKNLRFTRAHHVVLSYQYDLARGNVKTELYYQKLFNAPVQTDPASFYTSLNEDTGFITDSLVNRGEGRNYGVEVSLSRPFSRNFYYAVNGSIFKSIFSIPGQKPRSSAYDGNYSLHILGGREFVSPDERRRLGVNFKLSCAGGRPYIPVDLERSIENNRQVLDWDEAFTRRLPAYFRTDLQLVYRFNLKDTSMEWRLDMLNLTNARNPGYLYYDNASRSVAQKRQIGFVPLISFRMEF